MSETIPYDLQQQLDSQTAEVDYILCIFFDFGRVIVAGGVRRIDGEVTKSGLSNVSSISSEGFSAAIEKSTLGITDSDRFKNRSAELWQVPIGAISLDSGRKLFDGSIQQEPSDSNGRLSLQIGKAISRLVLLPPQTALIDTDTYPNAASGVAGRYKGTQWGAIDDVELLGVDVPTVTALASDAVPADGFLSVKDATGLAASGSVVVDGITYTYSARDDNTLLGMTITGYHYSGTAVAVTGSAVFSIANHAVTATDNIKGDGSPIDTGTVDLSAATVTFSTVPTVPDPGVAMNLQVNFDTVNASNTVPDAVKTIKAATGSDTGVGTITSLPLVFGTGSLELTRSSSLAFPASSGDPIIRGTYSVTYTVSATGFDGDGKVFIGGTVVWSMRAGVVVYNPGAVAITYDENTNYLPLEITRNKAGSAIDVTISAASRTIVLGNLDETAYAVMDTGEVLLVDQITAEVDRGSITLAQVVVEFFPTDEYLTSTQAEVFYNGNKLGELTVEQLAGSTTVDNINISVPSTGDATFQNSDITTTVNDSVATIVNTYTEEVVNYPVQYLDYDPIGQTGTVRLYPPKNVKTGLGINHVATIRYGVGTNNEGGGVITDSTGSKSFGSPTSGGVRAIFVNVTSSGVELVYQHAISGLYAPKTVIRGITLSVAWVIDKIDVNDTAATGSTTANNNLPVSVSGVGSDVVTITLPAQPRTIINTFTFPLSKWSDLTSKQLKITYGGADSIAIVRAFIAVNYNATVNKPASTVTANVTGSSGNPADIIKYLIEATGDKMDMASYAKVYNWMDLNGWVFARRVDTPDDALRLLDTVVKAALCTLYESNGRNELIRDLDFSVDQTVITSSNLLAPFSFEWSQNNITGVQVNYGNEQVKIADHTTNVWLARAYRDAGKIENLQIYSGFWFGDNTTVDNFLIDYARLNGPSRRIATIQIAPEFYGITGGDQVYYTGINDGTTFRVESSENDKHFPTLQIEEIPE